METPQGREGDARQRKRYPGVSDTRKKRKFRGEANKAAEKRDGEIQPAEMR